MSEEKNAVSVFHFENNSVRTKVINSLPMFCLADVCKVLEIKTPANVKSRLNLDGVDTINTIDNLGRTQPATFINESNLYKVIFQSRKPEAEKFTEWVTSEVLPSIRKHGGYLSDTKIEEALLNPDTIIRLATDLKKEREEKRRLENLAERRQNIIDEQKQSIGKLLPDAEYANEVLASENLHTVKSIGVHLGVSATRLNKWLIEQGLIYRQGNLYYPTRKIQGKGYCDYQVIPYLNRAGEKCTREHLKWSETGRRAVIELWEKQHSVKQAV